jgi:probable biosynthetic protein (TIGR04098 family)
MFACRQGGFVLVSLSMAPAEKGCSLAAEAPGNSLTHSWAVLLGMPHLAVVGLSETWLIKEAGHVHWQLLEEAVGCRSRHWKDEHGHRLYASFIAYRLKGSLLSVLGDGDLLECVSELGATSRNRFCSRHVLRCASLPFEAELWMVTSFIRRDGEGGGNRAFVRSTFGASAPLHGKFGATFDELLARRRHCRRESDELRTGPHSVTRFAVCPMEDFNHAGMVYFATFPRYLDRAEQRARPLPDLGLRPLVSRDCFYYGNADAGDEIEAIATADEGAALSQIWSGGALLCASESIRGTP